MAGCIVGTLIGLRCVAAIITIADGIAYGIQHRNENNFLENLCLVIDAEVVTHSCDLRTPSHTSEHGKYAAVAKFLLSRIQNFDRPSILRPADVSNIRRKRTPLLMNRNSG